METVSLKEKIEYNCELCLVAFSRPESFKKHMKTIHGKTIVVCSSCPLYFDELGQLFLHARQTHNVNRMESKPNKTHQCEFERCTYQTNNGGLFRHHMRSHFNIKKFTCIICDKKFTQKSNMKTHFNRHKKTNNPFRCELCDKEFNSHDTYLSHLETREHFIGVVSASISVKFKCLACLEILNCAEDVYEHIFTCQSSESFPISCEVCFKKLSHDIDSLKEHAKFHKNDLTCPLCEHHNSFTDKTKLNLHMTKVHNERVFRRPVCRYCEMLFANEEERNKHINELHLDLKNKHQSRDNMGRIVCQVESCTFSTNSEILSQKHYRKHFGLTDIDSYYETEIKRENEIIENSVSQPRKRGRPRICDERNNSGYATISTNNSSENGSIKRKRGRPRKTEEPPNTLHNETKKRGRPRKIKCEDSNSSQNHVKLEVMENGENGENGENEDNIEYNLEEFERMYNSGYYISQSAFNETMGNLEQQSTSTFQIPKFDPYTFEEIPTLENLNNPNDFDNFDIFRNFQEFDSSNFYELNDLN